MSAAVVLRGATGQPEDVILDASTSGRHITATDIDGFAVEAVTLSNHAWYGVLIQNGAATFSDCHFRDGGVATYLGANGTDLGLYRCTFFGFYNYESGGGVHLFAGNEGDAAGIAEGTAVVPGPVARFALHANAPNPFNPATKIRYDLPEAATVSLRVFDISGRLVRKLLDAEAMPAGRRSVDWNGRDDAGRTVSSGLYFYRIEAGPFRDVKRMTLLK